MLKEALSRRGVFRTGAAGLAATALVQGVARAEAPSGEASANEAIVLKWYKLWETEKKDWAPFDALLADDFNFTSPVDDHISKSAFKKGCWDTQIAFIAKFDPEFVSAKGDEAVVKYLCHTTNGKSFRNVEYLRLNDRKIEAIECYFGGNLTFPSAVSAQKS